MRILIAVDLQEEFADKLGNYQRIVDFVNTATCYDKIIATQFVNSVDSPFVKYVHWTDCMGVLKPLGFKASKVYEKRGYGLLDYSDFSKDDEYDIIGYNTDACVLKIAEDLFDRGHKIHILSEYCFSSDGLKNHLDGVELLKRLMGDVVI